MNASHSDKIEEEARKHPLTWVLTMAVTLACAFGLIYTFAFSDTAEQRWQHFGRSFALAAFLGTCLAFAKKREDSGPLSIRARRAVWLFVLLCYVGAVGGILWLGASPFSRPLDTLRLVCYLGGASPMAFIAWKLFRSQPEQPAAPRLR